MSKPSMLIAGATGFIGRNLVEHFLRQGSHEVIAVCNLRPPYHLEGVRWIKADLCRSEDVTRALAGVDVLIQAAATTSGVKDIISQPHIHVADNAVMNSLIFRAAHDLKVRHVVFFSCTVMLQSSEHAQAEEEFNEAADIHPRYFGSAWTKVYVEKMAEFYSGLGNTRFTVIRHSNVYGPYDKFDMEHSHVFGATVTKVMMAQESVTIWGTGEEARDLLYINDLVNFVERALQRQPGRFGLYNCGSGVAVKINALVEQVISCSGRKLKILHDLAAPSIPTSLSLSCVKAERELGWKAQTNLQDGILKTINWWLDNNASNQKK